MEESQDYSPNTIYVIGTGPDAQLKIQSTRTSFDAAKDYHIMSAALELSQAVELRGVSFGEHAIGSLIVRPVTSKDPESKLDDNESDQTLLWAEIHRLRARLQGPSGYSSWQEAATAERVKRVEFEGLFKQERERANEAHQEVLRLREYAEDHPEPIRMALCSVPYVHLRPDVTYRFEVKDGCDNCAQAAALYKEAPNGPNG